jgi:hypothetical protein
MIGCVPAMATELLDTFMQQDCTPRERSLLLEAVARWDARQPPVKQHLEFNRFEFTFDAEERTIVIDDILDASESGTEILSAERLKAALQQ